MDENRINEAPGAVRNLPSDALSDVEKTAETAAASTADAPAINAAETADKAPAAQPEAPHDDIPEIPDTPRISLAKEAVQPSAPPAAPFPGVQQGAYQPQYGPQYGQNAQNYPPAAMYGSQQYAQMRYQQAPRYPQPAYAPAGYYPPAGYAQGANVSGYANAYPQYTFQKPPKEVERDKLRSASNTCGGLTIAITFAIEIAAFAIMIAAFIFGVMLETPELNGDPYFGLTAMGYYLFTGLSSLIGVFIPALIVMKIAKTSQKLTTDDLIPFKPIGGKKLAAVVFAGLSVAMLAQILAVIIDYNFSLFGIEINGPSNNLTYGTKPLDIVMNTICIALIPALVEEFAYRGVVLGVLKRYDPMLAVLGSSFLFAMLHGNLGQIPFTFILGIAMAYARIKTDSMLPSILIHFGNNFYAVILSTIEDNVPKETLSIIDYAVVVLFIMVGFISFYYLSKTDRSFFKLEQKKSLLTSGERTKTFFSSGAVIASIIILCIEAALVIELL